MTYVRDVITDGAKVVVVSMVVIRTDVMMEWEGAGVEADTAWETEWRVLEGKMKMPWYPHKHLHGTID
jgi:hypothetical protein